MLSITIVNIWGKRATNFILGIILHLMTVIQIDIIALCFGKIDTGRGHSAQLWVLVKYHLFLIIVLTLPEGTLQSRNSNIIIN